jgi:hypothetical protein
MTHGASAPASHDRVRLGISACLLDQIYLRPHPVELMLRNHV